MHIIRRLYVILLYAAALLPLATHAHTTGGESVQWDSCVHLRLHRFTPLSIGGGGRGMMLNFSQANVAKPSQPLRCMLCGDSVASLLFAGTRTTLGMMQGWLTLTSYETPQLKMCFQEPPTVMISKVAYGDSTVGTFSGTGEYCDRLRLKIDGCYTLAADGLGTLVTPDGGTPRYGGEVSAMDWQAAGDSLRGYRYQYDALGRLAAADYREGGLPSDRYMAEYSYDLMGNITSLYRRGRTDGGYGVIDDLAYRYDGNHLVKVTAMADTDDDYGIETASMDMDGVTYKGAMLYHDGADMDTERTYDANGSMVSDADRGITHIDYDSNRLPRRIDLCDGSHIDYTYSADGVKLRVDYYLNPYTPAVPDGEFGIACDSSLLVHTWREYAGNRVYDNGVLSRLLFDGGYVSFRDSVPTYHYYIRDYLGNNRVVADAHGNVEEVNHYYPYGALMGDSRGTGLQPYKYIGKELDRTHGLDWYDHGARHYDPVTGRWNTMDSMCEKYYGISPYASCGDDPVNAVDPDGMNWYRDKDRTWQFDPNVHSQEDLGKGQVYKGVSFSTGKGDNLVNYRADGSILYANETMAYNRMWSQASVHYRNQGEKGGREVGAFFLTNGKILVMPDYKNTSMDSYIGEYGYKIGYGTLTKDRETFRISGQIHTHQERTSDVRPSYADGKVSGKMGGLPVFTMGHNGGVYAIHQDHYTRKYCDLDIPFQKKGLLNGKIKLSIWLKAYRNYSCRQNSLAMHLLLFLLLLYSSQAY